MPLESQKLKTIINDIRYADVIVSYKDTPYSVKISTCLDFQKNYIEFHVPKRCTEIIDVLDMKKSFLLKYSTEYAEVSSEWCVDAPKNKRISTIIGVEIHIKDQAICLNDKELLEHLYDTQNQNKQRINDNFSIQQLDKEYFEDAFNEIKGYRIPLTANNYKTVENTVSYRNEKDKKLTIENLERLSKENKDSNKFSIATKLI